MLCALLLVAAYDLLEYRYVDDVVQTSVTHEPHFFVFTTFWPHLWSVTALQNGIYLLNIRI